MNPHLVPGRLELGDDLLLVLLDVKVRARLLIFQHRVDLAAPAAGARSVT